MKRGEIMKRKIIHVPLEIAGQVGLICEFLRKHGYESVGFNYFPNYLNYKQIINTDAYELAKLLDPAIKYFDLFHFHNSYTFIDDYRDIEMIASVGKKMIMHHRGNDVRARSWALQGEDYTNPYVDADESFPDDLIEKNLNYFSDRMACAIVQDYELYKYVYRFYNKKGKKVHVLPRLIDTSWFFPSLEVKNQRPLIVHAPTNRKFKGTDSIESVIETLQKEIPFDYKRVEQLSHQQALELYKQADLVIDQILCGAYGNLSVEAMALGKPVICYIRPDLMDLYPKNLPIVSANPDTLYDVLKNILRDREQRIHLGRMGRIYVEEYHEASKVVHQLIQIYEEVLKQ
jgi:glycosyltransferase involved in cell wall biosynthesis